MGSTLSPQTTCPASKRRAAAERGVAACLLVLGGGLGNYIDRILRGFVVDMLDLQFMSYPIFNLADCFVVVGALLGAVYYLWIYDKHDKRKPDDDNAASHN